MKRDSLSFSFAVFLLVAIIISSCSHVKSVPIPAAVNVPGGNLFLVQELANGNFALGELGQWPLGWHRWASYKIPTCDAEIVSAHTTGPNYANCKSGGQCAKLRASGQPFPAPCFFAQGINANSYRGKSFAFRANVRAEVSAPSIVYMLVRVHTDASRVGSTAPVAATTFFEHVPVTSEKWANYEIKGVVDADAHDIELGVQIRGEGDAWIDSATLRFSKNPKYPPVADTPRVLSSLLRYERGH